MVAYPLPSWEKLNGYVTPAISDGGGGGGLRETCSLGRNEIALQSVSSQREINWANSACALLIQI